MPPLVLLDATPLAGPANDRASAAWVGGLLAGLAECPATERPQLVLAADTPSPAGFVAHRLRTPPGLRARLRRGPSALPPAVAGADLVHLTSRLAVDVFAPVMTCLDLLPLRFPALVFGVGGGGRSAYNAYLDRLARARMILVPTASVGVELTELLAIPERRIRVAPLPVGTVSAVAAPVGGPPTVLVVANREPFTNADLAVRALAATDPGTGLELVVAGVGERRRRDRLARRAAALGVDARVRILGPLGTRELDELRAGATIAAVPALADAASAPAIAAMAAGVPVTASDARDLDGVLGDAALRLPLGRPGTWGAAWTALAGDAERRAGLAEAGRTRAVGLTPAATTAVVRDVWAEALDA
jgi:glycosyltransferase involved in cell wall biosynthesis